MLESLLDYASVDNKYTFPSDGYIFVSSENNTSGTIRVIICDRTGEGIAYIYMNITGKYQAQSLWVRKGMQAFISQKVDGCVIKFQGITT